MFYRFFDAACIAMPILMWMLICKIEKLIRSISPIAEIFEITRKEGNVSFSWIRQQQLQIIVKLVARIDIVCSGVRAFSGYVVGERDLTFADDFNAAKEMFPEIDEDLEALEIELLSNSLLFPVITRTKLEALSDEANQMRSFCSDLLLLNKRTSEEIVFLVGDRFAVFINSVENAKKTFIEKYGIGNER